MGMKSLRPGNSGLCSLEEKARLSDKGVDASGCRFDTPSHHASPGLEDGEQRARKTGRIVHLDLPK